MPRPGKRKTLMFSATFPQTIQQFVADFMDSEYLFIKVGVVGGACADVSQEVLIIGSEESKKSGKLEELIKVDKLMVLPYIYILLFSEKSIFI